MDGDRRYTYIACYGWLWIHDHRKVEGRLSNPEAPDDEGLVDTASPVFDYRASRGAEIARVESNVRRIDQHEYRVRSQSGNGE